ncbi:coiled-coil domain-containing protein 18-like [Dreissena polymorpha]|uniref:Uncharacterized protein n=1 Tax=Dreissena polymorpha TaxID=45954 RepID=A0A9D4HZK5_DREPO|nr:coiled-coil domain-containing protein 18-like [Dreissena polymorpha]KAH3738638.1 hypothetical protein DPMN_045277 [Dreissena polymorpha]
MEPMLENEQQPIHGEVKISFESEIRKHVTEVQQQIGVLEDKFRNDNREMKTSVETITAKNDEIANGLDNLEKQIRQQQQEELHKVEKMEQTISQNMKELHQNKEMLDRKMSENEERWNSVMRTSDTENATIQLKEQMRLLEKLKQENLFQKDKFKDCMKEMQKAKDTEVATLRIQLQEAEHRGRIHILRQEIEAAKKQIVISEGILTKTIDEMTTEISQLETKRSELQASLRNVDAANLREKRALENRIEFLGAEVVKRNTCISILETRLSKTKITMRSLDQLSESDYETYRGLVQRWQEDDGRLHVESDEIKQRFFRGDGQSIVETLTWVQNTISGLPGDCIHANDFQRISDIIRKALRGDYTEIRTDFAFTQRNCVVQ